MKRLTKKQSFVKFGDASKSPISPNKNAVTIVKMGKRVLHLSNVQIEKKA